jgi:DNA-binding LacI/PurR family transcriptional regulator
MTAIPERITLVTQLADILRDGIRKGEWSGTLPGQRELSEQLQVSRPTLRAALHLLRKEGYLQIAHGRRMRITLSPRRHKKIIRTKTIGFLSPLPLSNLSYSSLFLICDLERRLADAGYKLEIHTEARFRQPHPFRALETLLRQTRAACWVLHFSTPGIQQWFSDRGLPAIISKARHEGVNLPAIDVDYHAIGYHAAAEFLRLGHQRPLLLLGKDRSAGDLTLVSGFQERFATAARPAGVPLTLHHDGTVGGIQRALNPLLRRPNRPTAILVSGSAATLTVCGQLRAQGIEVPREVSVVCSLDDPLLAYHVPAPARYTVRWDLYASGLLRLVLQQAASGAVRAPQLRIMAEFQRGETLAVAPA